MANAHDTDTIAEQEPKAMVRDAKETLKQEGQRLAAGVKAKADSLAAEQKGMAKGYLNDFSEAVHDLTSTLDKQGHGAIAQYTRTAAEELGRMGQAIEARDFTDLAREVSEFARRRPALFFGGAFALGFGLSRFLASSRPGRAPGLSPSALPPVDEDRYPAGVASPQRAPSYEGFASHG